MDDKVTNITAAKKTSKPRAFVSRNKTKIAVAATTVAAATLFLLGRKSKDVVESVDVNVDVNTPSD